MRALVHRAALALWELPQNLLGAAVFGAAWATRNVARIDREGERWVIDSPLGVSLGSFVFYNDRGNRYFAPDPLMRRHELGHTFQSRLLGPLYLPLVGVPSVARVVYGIAYREITGARWENYFAGYPESWADRLGGIAPSERQAWVRDTRAS